MTAGEQGYRPGLVDVSTGQISREIFVNEEIYREELERLFARAVAAQDHRFLAHPRDKEITGLRDLALMPDEEPSAREQPLQLFPVDLLVDENFATDPPRLQVDETGPISMSACGHNVLPARSIHLPGEACPWQGTGGRDPWPKWASAFAGVARALKEKG